MSVAQGETRVFAFISLWFQLLETGEEIKVKDIDQSRPESRILLPKRIGWLFREESQPYSSLKNSWMGWEENLVGHMFSTHA